MKINKNLSRYVLDKKGDVYDKSTGDQVELETKTEYKLVTDEIFKSYKGKSSNIVRRFTRDQIVKIYNSPDSVSIESGSKEDPIKENPIVDQKPETTTSEPIENKDVVEGEFYQFEIFGVKYRNAKEASKAIGVSPNTITNRAKKGVEGYKVL